MTFNRRTSASTRRGRQLLLAVVAALSVTAALLVSDAGRRVNRAAADTPTRLYQGSQTYPAAPATNFAGQGGGDGWAIAVSTDKVYNVVHHTTLAVACHLQSDASSCWFDTEQPPQPLAKVITDANGTTFQTNNTPGMLLDSNNGHLYVYAVRDSDVNSQGGNTGGVVCIDTTQPANVANPFCGFTALTAVGESPTSNSVTSGIAVGTKFYAFNGVAGQPAGGTATNKVVCFNTATQAACAGSPYAISLGTGALSDFLPIAVIGSQLILPVVMTVGASSETHLACLDTTTNTNCGSGWPIKLASGVAYSTGNGPPFPLLSNTAALTGFCLPDGTEECFTIGGQPAATATPANLADVISSNSSYQGPAQVVGTRVFVPNSSTMACYDYAASASCPNFPLSFNNLSGLYTVNPDPQRPTCLWVNSDSGNAQIQNFDAYNSTGCGNSIRAQSVNYVPPACTPTNYNKIQITDPPRSGYASATVSIDDANGNAIAGQQNIPVDGAGSVNLATRGLTGRPQFVVTIVGRQSPGTTTIQLTWTGPDDASCGGGGGTCYHALTPARILDTRDGTGGFNSPIGPNTAIDLTVAGHGNVPATGVAAVVVNVTVDRPTEDGYLELYPTGSPPANPTSNVNFLAGQTVPNSVIAPLNANGSVSIYNLQGQTPTIVDVLGWLPVGSCYHALTPNRILDTRDGTGGINGKITGGLDHTVDVTVTGRGGVPAADQVSAVVLNVTSTESDMPGYLELWPTGHMPVDRTSNVNFQARQSIPNLVIAPVGDNGQVTIHNLQGHTHVIFDVMGWLPIVSSYHPVTPNRILDTRSGTGGFNAPVGPNGTIDVSVLGGELPASGVSAVVLNVTVDQPTADSYLSLYGTGHPPATPTSNLNFHPGQVAVNLVIAPVGDGGKVTVYNLQGNVHVIFDVMGWLPT